MKPFHSDDLVTIHHGDSLTVLAADTMGYDHRLGYFPPLIADSSIDAVVTDPPYGLEFMGKDWDAPWKAAGAVIKDPATERGGFQDGNGGNPYSRSRIEYGRGGDASTGFQEWCELWATECLRVLKPGGHMLAFGGTRTFHRLACAIEDAGFEIRDSIAWMHGSGFPKSLDVSKAIDKRRDDHADVVRVTTWLRDQAAAKGITRAAVDAHLGTSDMGGWWLSDLPHRCAVPTWDQWLSLRDLIGFDDEMDTEVWRLNGRKGEPGEAWDQRAVIGTAHRIRRESVTQIAGLSDGEFDVTAPASEAAKQWKGWGTALKPSFEPIVVARKPLTGTVAANVLAHGTGALNIDASRIASSQADKSAINAKHAGMDLATYERPAGTSLNLSTNQMPLKPAEAHAGGRWPANVILDETQAAELDRQSGEPQSRIGTARVGAPGDGWQMSHTGAEYDDVGGASRFFYTAKAPSSERVRVDGIAHPTVKPLALMRWLVKLITPPSGIVLEPFAGSGTTVEACMLEGFQCVAIEREADYLPLIVQRLNRRRDPVAAVQASGQDSGLFDLLEDPA